MERINNCDGMRITGPTANIPLESSGIIIHISNLYAIIYELETRYIEGIKTIDIRLDNIERANANILRQINEDTSTNEEILLRPTNEEIILTPTNEEILLTPTNEEILLRPIT
tara:strand:+ start:152 stop:490 length:339 start_codon:yes stop_codon:yes gene_type:complete